MSFTIEQLKEMTRSEINLEIAKRKFKYCIDISESGDKLGSVSIVREVDDKLSLEGFNPCHDWNDTMPLAQENEMVVNFEINAIWAFESLEHCEDMQRAICEMFLLLD